MDLIQQKPGVYNPLLQSTKILQLPPKCEIVVGTLAKQYFFQYCISNNELFSLAPHIVIALPTLQQKKLSLLTIFCIGICIASHIVVAFPTSATQKQMSHFYALKGDSEKYQKSSLRLRKSDNYRYSNIGKINNWITP